MRFYKYFFFVFFLLTFFKSEGQICECNCEQIIPDTTSINVYLNVTGAVNDDLANADQGVCEVCVKFKHTLLPDLEMVLTSPSGQSIMLIGESQIATQTTSTDFSTFDICFIPDNQGANPFGSTQANWTNNDLWPAFSPNVMGTYYPYDGSLGDFNTGTVNGTWTLGIADELEDDSGELLQFTLTFCDPVGVDCFPCESDAGSFDQSNLVICREDADLTYSFEPQYIDGAPDPDEYNFITFIASQDTLLAYGDSFDFNLFPLAEYQICGLSYLRFDSIFLPDPVVPITIHTFDSLLGSVTPFMCADISDQCVTVNLYDALLPTFVSDTICLGECTNIGTISYCATGIYLDTIMSQHGCDSIVNLDLTVVPPVNNFIFEIICLGDSIVVFDTVLYAAGNYTIVGPTAFGCDSIVDIGIQYFDSSIDTLEYVACEGSTIVVLTETFFTDTTFYDTLVSVQGCDSISFFDLTFYDEISIDQVESICELDTIFVGDSKYFETGIYIDTFVSSLGCDSIVTTDLTVFTEIVIDYNDTICNLDTILFAGELLFQTGLYSDTVMSSFGCDSITNLSLQVNLNSFVDYNEIICFGDTFFMAELPYTLSGVYNDTITSANGCDSILNLSLFASPQLITLMVEDICSGDTLFLGDNNYSSSGVYFDTLASVLGCDSIINVILGVDDPVTDTTTVEICVGDSVLFGGQYYSLFGLYRDSLKINGNCDSISYLRLNLKAPTQSMLNLTLCQQDTFIFGGEMIDMPGDYVDTIVNAVGCDSVIQLTVDFLPSFLVETDTALCIGEVINFGNLVYDTPGDYLDTIQTLSGCDSIFDLSLSYFDQGMSTYFDTLCQGETIVFLGKSYTATGIYLDTVLTDNGCDSMINIDIALRDYFYVNLLDTFCLGSEYTFNNIQITNPGTFNDTLQGDNTCDTIVILDLSQEVCDLNMTLLTTFEDCFGQGALEISMVGGEPMFSFVLTGLNNGGIFMGTFNAFETTVTSIPFDTYFVQITDANGDIVNDNLEIGFENSFQLFGILAVDYNGFNTSCFGVEDGSITVNTQNGVLPLQYILNNGNPTTQNEFTNLASGWHYITIVDDIGCTLVDSILLEPQPPMEAFFDVGNPNCLGGTEGSIEIVEVLPTTNSVEVSFDGNTYSDQMFFENLSVGDYSLSILDEWGCQLDTIISIQEPLPLQVALQDEYTINLGAYLNVEAFVNIDTSNIDSIMWTTPYTLACDSCLATTLMPLQTSNISIIVYDANGCVAEASSTIVVVADQPIFIPSVFTPNGDGENDVLQLFSLPNLDYFVEFDIYGRWGEHVFHAENFRPGEPIGMWDGYHNGQLLNSAVFMYTIRYVLKNGYEIQESGDITLMR